MGLDLVELVMEVEDEFGIDIDDADASRIETVGQLHAYIVTRLSHRRVSACPSASAFYRLRAALLAGGIAERSAIAPSARWAEWFQKRGGREAWGELLRRLDLRLSKNPFPGRTRRALTIILPKITLIALIVLLGAIVTNLLPQLAAPAMIVIFLSIIVAIWLGTSLPKECETIRGFVQHCAPAISHISENEVWERLTTIVSEQLDVDRDKLRPETHFIKDLHAS